MDGPEVTGSRREGIVFGEIDGKSKGVIEFLLGDHDEIGEAQGVEPTTRPEENRSRRRLDPLFPGQLLVEIRNRFVDHLQYVIKTAGAILGCVVESIHGLNSLQGHVQLSKVETGCRWSPS